MLISSEYFNELLVNIEYDVSNFWIGKRTAACIGTSF